MSSKINSLPLKKSIKMKINYDNSIKIIYKENSYLLRPQLFYPSLLIGKKTLDFFKNKYNSEKDKLGIWVCDRNYNENKFDYSKLKINSLMFLEDHDLNQIFKEREIPIIMFETNNKNHKKFIEKIYDNYMNNAYDLNDINLKKKIENLKKFEDEIDIFDILFYQNMLIFIRFNIENDDYTIIHTIPDFQFKLELIEFDIKYSSLKISELLLNRYCKHNENKNNLKFGFLSLDVRQRIYILNYDDKDIYKYALIGVWICGLDAEEFALENSLTTKRKIWSVWTNFYRNPKLKSRISWSKNSDKFLLLLFDKNKVIWKFEVSLYTETSSYNTISSKLDTENANVNNTFYEFKIEANLEENNKIDNDYQFYNEKENLTNNDIKQFSNKNIDSNNNILNFTENNTIVKKKEVARKFLNTVLNLQSQIEQLSHSIIEINTNLKYLTEQKLNEKKKQFKNKRVSLKKIDLEESKISSISQKKKINPDFNSSYRNNSFEDYDFNYSKSIYIPSKINKINVLENNSKNFEVSHISNIKTNSWLQDD